MCELERGAQVVGTSSFAIGSSALTAGLGDSAALFEGSELASTLEGVLDKVLALGLATD
jgi:hypothetical protein